MRHVTNVLMILAVSLVISNPVMALTFTSQETLSPVIQFVPDTKWNSCSLPVAKAWKSNFADWAFYNEGLRTPEYQAKTGISEANYMQSIIQGLPSSFWGSYVDWRNPAHAVKVYRYMVEVMGFDPNQVGVMMSQDGFGVTSYKPRNFRIYSPAIKVGNSVIVFLDKEYLDSVGVPPENMHHSQLVTAKETLQARNYVEYSPWPKQSSAKISMTIVVDTVATGPDHRGGGNDHLDNGKNPIELRGNSSH